jgi:hypothetical protein
MRHTTDVNNNVMGEWGKVAYDGHLREGFKVVAL